MTKNARIIAITRGKGGVGKTHISANLGVLLAKTGRKICVIDADHGLANVNLILGMSAVNQAQDRFKPNCDPISCMLRSEHGVDVLPAVSGTSQKGSELPPSKMQISLLLSRLKPQYDVILVDTAAGIDEGVKNYLSLADHALLVINSEPTSLTDGFGLIRRMNGIQPFYNVLINRVSSAAAATSAYQRFAGAVRKYIGAQVAAIGYVCEDSFMPAAGLSQTPVVSYSPSCLASLCLRRIARKLGRQLPEVKSTAEKRSSPDKSGTITNQTSATGDLLNEVHIAQKKRPESQASIVINVEATPAIPKFIRNDSKTDTFDRWLSQINQYFERKSNSDKTRKYRTSKLLQKLERLCDKDPKFRVGLESIMARISARNSDPVVEQTSVAERWVQTRLAEELTVNGNNRRVNQGCVSREFSAISKLK